MSDGIDAEQLGWPDLDALEEATSHGDYRLLAEYLRTDYPLHPNTREWLARLLLDELPARPSGNPRNKDTRLKDWRLFSTVIQRIDREGISQEKALTDYSLETDETLDAVRSRYKRARKRWGIPK